MAEEAVQRKAGKTEGNIVNDDELHTALAALVSLGYKQADAQQLIRSAIPKITEDMSLPDILRFILSEGKVWHLERALRQEEKRKVREQTDALARRTAGATKSVLLPGGATMEMVWCPPGSFLMGSSANEDGRMDDETQHRVTLTEGFWMAKYPVTQKQWKSVMGGNPSYFKGDNLPVECVNWNDCQVFCLKAGNGLRLPTEAEWEYACRAGSAGAYGGTGQLKEMGWYGALFFGHTHPVGEKRPNAWGLYDMHGNVSEWCADWYDSGYYAESPGIDPQGPASGVSRVLRGGSYWNDPQYCRSAGRGRLGPGGGGRGCGFRPVGRQN